MISNCVYFVKKCSDIYNFFRIIIRQLYSVKNMNFQKCINMKIFIGLEGTKLLISVILLNVKGPIILILMFNVFTYITN